MITDNKHYINAIKLHSHLLVLHGIYVTICWTSDDCDGQVDLKLHLSVGQGDIQVLRNADGGGGGSYFPEKALRRCNVQCY